MLPGAVGLHAGAGTCGEDAKGSALPFHRLGHVGELGKRVDQHGLAPWRQRKRRVSSRNRPSGHNREEAMKPRAGEEAPRVAAWAGVDAGVCTAGLEWNRSTPHSRFSKYLLSIQLMSGSGDKH